MSDWRVYSVEIDLKTGKWYLKAEIVIDKAEWYDTYVHMLRERNLAEKIVFRNICQQNIESDNNDFVGGEE